MLRLARFHENSGIESLLLQHGAMDNSDPFCGIDDYLGELECPRSTSSGDLSD